MDWKSCVTRCFSTSFSRVGFGWIGKLLESNRHISEWTAGSMARSDFIDDLSKTELQELLGDCVRDFRYWHFSEVAREADEVGSSTPSGLNPRHPLCAQDVLVLELVV
jgi:hypothetical protein